LPPPQPPASFNALMMASLRSDTPALEMSAVHGTEAVKSPPPAGTSDATDAVVLGPFTALDPTGLDPTGLDPTGLDSFTVESDAPQPATTRHATARTVSDFIMHSRY